MEEKYKCFLKYGLDIGPNELVQLIIDDSDLLIKAKTNTYQIPQARIKSVVHTRETELIQQGKNMLGRAVVGGLLLGPVGAVVGGASGLGKKKAKGDFVVVQYSNSAGEDAAIIFSPGGFFTGEKLAKRLTELIGVGDTITL